MRRRGTERELLGFDFTVMRAHDLYVRTQHKTICQMVDTEGDFGLNRIFQTLRMILEVN